MVSFLPLRFRSNNLDLLTAISKSPQLKYGPNSCFLSGLCRNRFQTSNRDQIRHHMRHYKQALVGKRGRSSTGRSRDRTTAEDPASSEMGEVCKTISAAALMLRWDETRWVTPTFTHLNNTFKGNNPLFLPRLGARHRKTKRNADTMMVVS